MIPFKVEFNLVASFEVTFDLVRRFEVIFEQVQEIPVTFGMVQVITEIRDADYYTGTYTVTPKDVKQVLPTVSKTMSEDVKVKAIPYYDVDNSAGGSTIYIGTMDE